MASSKSARTVLTIVMDLLVIVAVILVLRVVVEFFGQLASADWGEALLAATSLFVVPLKIAPIATPYGGSFNVDAAATVLLVLGVEWALGMARNAS